LFVPSGAIVTDALTLAVLAVVWSLAFGLTVPMPTLPVALMRIFSVLLVAKTTELASRFQM
jgi:hypothetical protein